MRVTKPASNRALPSTSPQVSSKRQERRGAEPGDLLVFVADSPRVVATSLGWLPEPSRASWTDTEQGVQLHTWITDFPMFDWNEEPGSGSLYPMFTMPKRGIQLSRPTREDKGPLRPGSGRWAKGAYG